VIKQGKRKKSSYRRKVLDKRPQILEGKLQKTFESPYKVFTQSDKREENDKLTLNRQGQRLIEK
jgi:hypothetical protein